MLLFILFKKFSLFNEYNSVESSIAIAVAERVSFFVIKDLSPKKSFSFKVRKYFLFCSIFIFPFFTI
jgi:hypothetical protein